MATHDARSAESGVAVGYLRDRSFYASRPSASYVPATHRESVTTPGMAACDTRFTPIDTTRPVGLASGRLCLRCFPAARVTTPGGGNDD